MHLTAPTVRLRFSCGEKFASLPFAREPLYAGFCFFVISEKSLSVRALENLRLWHSADIPVAAGGEVSFRVSRDGRDTSNGSGEQMFPGYAEIVCAF